jgi:hypothetical protein
MRQPTEQEWGVGGLVVIAIAAVMLVIFASTANATSTTIIDVPSATRYGQDNIFTEPTGHDGETCLVTLMETNEAQPSANPGNSLTLTTGDVYLVVDIETKRGGFGETSIIGVVGPTATLTWHINKVSSAGAAVSLDCEQEPPSTTEPPPETTTTTGGSTTTSTQPDSTDTTVQLTTTTSSTPTPETTTTTTTSSIPPSSPTTTSMSPPSSVTVPPSIPTGVPTGVGEPDASGQGPVFWFFILVVGIGGGIVGALGVAWWAVSQKQQ